MNIKVQHPYWSGKCKIKPWQDTIFYRHALGKNQEVWKLAVSKKQTELRELPHSADGAVQCHMMNMHTPSDPS